MKSPNSTGTHLGPLFCATMTALLTCVSDRVQAEEVIGQYSAASAILGINAADSGVNAAEVSVAPIIFPAAPLAQGTGQASGLYNVRFGRLGFRAAMTATASPVLDPVTIDRMHQVIFSGSFKDQVTITAPGVPAGTRGSFWPVIYINGRMEAQTQTGTAGLDDGGPSANSSISGRLLASYAVPELSVHEFQYYDWSQAQEDGYNLKQSSTPWAPGLVIFEFGVPFELEVSAQATVSLRTSAGSTASGSTELITEMSWQGVAGLARDDGGSVDGFTFQSDSEFDYGTPLEPGDTVAPTIGFNYNEGSGLTLTWPSILYQLYQPQWTDDPVAGNWEPLDLPVMGTGDVISIAESNFDLPGKFYRVKLIGP